MSEMVNVISERVYLEDRTLSSMYLNGTLLNKALELPWLDNKRAVSCVPEGTYVVTKEPPKPTRPYWHFRVHNVPGRSGILWHRGIRPKHSKGCVLVGNSFDDIDLRDSTKALEELVAILPDKFTWTVKKKGA
jgi:hypothetical protein